MRNKRIFITGGTGFFGKNILLHCSELKDNFIVLLSREPEKIIRLFPYLKKNKRIEFLKGDVRDFRFPEANFNYIFHGATPSVGKIPDQEMQSVIVDGIKRILEFSYLNKHLTNLLFISSGAVYGNKFNDPPNEDFVCDPVNIYGKSKLEAEELCLNSGIPCNIARCFAFVGEYLPLDAHFAIGNFILDCLKKTPIIIKGDGTSTRSYLYTGDLINWLWKILQYGRLGAVYNVGSDYEISIAELAKTVRKVAGTDNEIQILKSPSGALVNTYIPDITKIRNELKLDMEIPLEDAIYKTIEYYKNYSNFISLSV